MFSARLTTERREESRRGSDFPSRARRFSLPHAHSRPRTQETESHESDDTKWNDLTRRRTRTKYMRLYVFAVCLLAHFICTINDMRWDLLIGNLCIMSVLILNYIVFAFFFFFAIIFLYNKLLIYLNSTLLRFIYNMMIKLNKLWSNN